MYSNELRSKAYKEPWVYPTLESIIPHVSYAFTISPKKQSNTIVEQRVDDQKIFTLLDKVDTGYKMYPELSTKENNYHYHGYISFNSYLNITKFYYYIIRDLKELCTFVIKEIDTYDWYIYCRKQKLHMKALHRNYDIPYRILSNLTTSIVTARGRKKVPKGLYR